MRPTDSLVLNPEHLIELARRIELLKSGTELLLVFTCYISKGLDLYELGKVIGIEEGLKTRKELVMY